MAASNPDKLRELQEMFLVEAAKYDVFPLDNSILARILAPRPSGTAGRDEFTYTGEIYGIPTSDPPSILNRDYTITAEIDVPSADADGMIVTMGGRFGGYGLYLLKGKPVFAYNLAMLAHFRWEGADALTPGKHTIVFDYKVAEAGFGKGGTGILTVDGTEVAKQDIPHSVPVIMPWDETFDVGIDTRTPVSTDYELPFRFPGTIEKVTFKLEPVQLTAAQ